MLVVLMFFHQRTVFSAEPVSRINSSVWSKIEDEWKKINSERNDVVWQYRVSLPFPADWPYKGVEFYYVYAAGQDLRNMIADGELIAGPWARIEITPNGQNFVVLTKKLKKIGIQGVRPLNSKEVDLNHAQNESPKVGYANYESNKKYYCWWIGANGVIADAVRPYHEAFFKSLECK